MVALVDVHALALVFSVLVMHCFDFKVLDFALCLFLLFFFR